MKGLSLKTWFALEKHPRKGLLPVEWVVMGYLLLTALLMAFMQTKLVNPEAMMAGRLRIVAMTVALWAVYRMLPCRLMHLARIVLQMALLSWWYPDTYEFNRLLPNLDHVVAGFEQQLFGCQPALLLSQWVGGAVASELMNLGYSAYFPMIVIVTLFYFIYRYESFNRASFVILTSFFVYYVIFIALPVTGPQYYYLAAGVENIAAGSFPNVGDYFLTHQEMMSGPGWSDGFFYHVVENAHAAGERPTAAFPSSHVGVSTILMLLAWQTRQRRFFWSLMPFYVLLCLSTVYVRAHYAVDVLGGWLSGVVFFLLLDYGYRKVVGEKT